MATVVKKVNLIKSDVGNNNNKFWRGTLFDNGDVLCEWGRVGDSGQSKTFPGAGQSFLEKKVSEKKRDGRNGEIAYREIELIDGGPAPSKQPTVASVQKHELKDIAKKQIKYSNPTVAKLIEYFTDVNAHQITQATGGKITYNYDSGMFQTPLGLVTQSNIDEANKILDKVGDLVVARKFDSSLNSLTNDYMMLVPQDIGHRRLVPSDFWSDLSKVQNQKGILDALQASLVTATKAPVKAATTTSAPVEQVFDVQIDLVEDGKVIDRLRKLYEKTRQSMHACYGLNVRKVYTVAINTVNQAFEKDGATMTNVWDLWHGTRSSNVLSILKGGLVIPPQSSPHVCGRMFGNGIYASDQSTKALNYAYGYWGGGAKDKNCFMFLLKMAMGKFFVPTGPFSGNARPGYDSTFAKGNQSGVANNEMIVYRTSQVKLDYLVEFSPDGK